MRVRGRGWFGRGWTPSLGGRSEIEVTELGKLESGSLGKDSFGKGTRRVPNLGEGEMGGCDMGPWLKGPQQ